MRNYLFHGLQEVQFRKKEFQVKYFFAMFFLWKTIWVFDVQIAVKHFDLVVIVKHEKVCLILITL